VIVPDDGMSIRFDLATGRDDAAIRRLLADNPVPGRVTVAYEREPSFALGCATLGDFCQVITARDDASGEIAALACRAARPMFVNGRPQHVGYLGQLRVDRRYRGRWLVSGGFRFLRALHDDGRAGGYVATVTEENREALGVLVAGARRHFPRFRELGRLVTLAIPVGRPRREPRPDLELGLGSERSLADIAAFLREHGARRQLFPVVTGDDLRGPATLGLEPSDLVVALRGGEIAGVLGLWDQSAYKQTVVRAYGGALGRVRPLYDAAARLRGRRPLPRPGERLRSAYASFACVAGDDRGVFRALLARVYALAAERGHAYLLLGLAGNDPLLDTARRYAHIPYHSRLYTVSWDDGGAFHEQFDGRAPHVEIALL